MQRFIAADHYPCSLVKLPLIHHGVLHLKNPFHPLLILKINLHHRNIALRSSLTAKISLLDPGDRIYCLFFFRTKIKFQQGTVVDSECRKFLIGHFPKIGLHNSCNTVMRHQKISPARRIMLNLIQQIVDPLCHLKH